MKRQPSLIRIPLLTLLMGIFVQAPAGLMAQGEARAEVADPSFDDLPSPNINPGKDKRFKPKDWLEVETKVKLDVRPTPKIPFLDRVTVKWYVAVQNPEGRGFLLLTKDVNHVNVPTDEEFYVSVYLSPSSIKRLTGRERAAKSTVDRVGVEILWNGVKVGQASSKGKAGWWNAASLSRSDKIPLLNKNETPFAIFWWDRYAQIEKLR